MDRRLEIIWSESAEPVGWFSLGTYRIVRYPMTPKATNARNAMIMPQDHEHRQADSPSRGAATSIRAPTTHILGRRFDESLLVNGAPQRHRSPVEANASPGVGPSG